MAEPNINTYSTETVKQIWNDTTGDCTEVGPDRDGLDLVEIRHRADGKISDRLIMEKEEAVLVARGILELYAGEKA